MTDKIVVFSACESKEQADRIARQLIENRLAACVSILPGVTSVYRWKDNIEASDEWLLLIKTRRGLFSALRAEVRKLHSYEVPEMIALPVVDGAPAYLGWMDDELKAAE